MISQLVDVHGFTYGFSISIQSIQSIQCNIYIYIFMYILPEDLASFLVHPPLNHGMKAKRSGCALVIIAPLPRLWPMNLGFL